MDVEAEATLTTGHPVYVRRIQDTVRGMRGIVQSGQVRRGKYYHNMTVDAL